MLKWISRSWLLIYLVFASALASATNYQKDSFDIYTFWSSPIMMVEREKIVLLHGEVITPIKYKDGASFSVINYNNSNSKWEAGLKYQPSSREVILAGGPNFDANIHSPFLVINPHVGDFNGDGHNDLLLQRDNFNSNATASYFTIVYGSNNEYPSNIVDYDYTGTMTLLDGSTANASHLAINTVELSINDQNNDGYSDIVVTYKKTQTPISAIIYGSSSGPKTFSFDQKIPDAGSSATKPSKGRIVPGGTAGSFRVTESGAASYNIPIYSPMGPGGMSASLSLNYNSHGGDGPLGKGWSIIGGGMISECSTNAIMDSDNSRSRFCLNGQRLIQTQGGSSTKRIYTTEIADISRIEGNVQSGKVSGFTIYKKDGSKQLYSNNGDRIFPLYREYNPTGSAYVQYSYKQGAAQLVRHQLFKNVTVRPTITSYLKEVGIYSSVGSSLIGKIMFNYDQRPDVFTARQDGAVINLNDRLQSVTVYNKSELVRDYTLSYQQSTFNDRSELKYIQECGQNSECYEPLIFNWSDPQLNENFLTYTNTGSGINASLKTGDFNGDGFIDIAINSQDYKRTVQVFMGKGNGSWIKGSLLNLDHKKDQKNEWIQVVDFNADGFSDIVYMRAISGGIGTNGCNWVKTSFEVQVYYSNGRQLAENTTFSNETIHNQTYSTGLDSYNGNSCGLHQIRDMSLVDMNGDGLLDLQYEMDTLYETDGAHFNGYKFHYIPRLGIHLQVREGGAIRFNAGQTIDDFEYEVVDQNPTLMGEGRCNTSLGFRTTLAVGDTRQIGVGSNFKRNTLDSSKAFMDFDGDGKVDILTRGVTYCAYGDSLPLGSGGKMGVLERTNEKASWYIVYSPFGKHQGLIQDLEIDINEEVLVGDFNADGLPDYHTSQALWENTGKSARYKVFEKKTPLLSIAGTEIEKFRPIDYNGDLATDYIYTPNDDSVYIGLNIGGEFKFTAKYDLEIAGKLYRDIISADVNADGIRDVLYLDSAGNLTTELRGVTKNAASSQPLHAITSIESSNGTVQNIEYAFGATDGTVYIPDSDALNPLGKRWIDSPMFDSSGAVHLVKRITESSPIYGNLDATVSKRYSYIGGKLQAGRGFLGFRKIIEVDEVNNVKIVNGYSLQYPYQGLPLFTYKVSKADKFDDSNIIGFDADDIRDGSGPARNSLTGFSPISNLDSSGNDTSNNLTECRSQLHVPDEDLSLTWLSCARNVWDVKEFATKHENDPAKYNPVFPYIKNTVEEVFHVKTEIGAFDGVGKLTDRGSILKTTKTSSEYNGLIDNFYAELTKQVVNTSVTSGGLTVWHEEKSEFKYEDNNVANWWLGRLTEQKVTTYTSQTKPSPSLNMAVGVSSLSSVSIGLNIYDISYLPNSQETGVQSVTRKTVFDYYDTTGLLKSSTIEPDHANFSIITSYTYDDHGNKLTVTKESHGNADSDLKFWNRSENEYDDQGIYANKLYEFPSGSSSRRLVSETTSRNAYGLPLTTKGQNNASVVFKYDGFGRKTKETASTGSIVEVTRDFCASDSFCSNSGGLGYLVETVTSNSAPATKSVSDKFANVIRASKQSFDGTWYHVDTMFNVKGEAITVSNPHTGSFGSATQLTETIYDLFGRPVRTKYPDGSQVYNEYDGLFTTYTDAFGLNKASLVDLMGNVIWVKEFKSIADDGEFLLKEVRYKYDLQGNQTQIISSGGTQIDGSKPNVLNLVTESIKTEYNLVGQSISTDDPSKGKWKYRKNAIGQVIAQVNPNGEYTVSVYDDLARKTSSSIRPITFGTDWFNYGFGAIIESTNWTYDNKSNGIGKLGSVTGTTSYIGLATSYGESYEYTTLGQLDNQTTTINSAQYKQSWKYDSVGRAYIHYDASNNLIGTPAIGTKTHFNAYHYANGLSDVSGNTFYFRPIETDKWGNVTKFEYGNGVVTNVAFDDIMGRLQTIKAGKGTALTAYIDHFYRFDALGNLEYRSDLNLGYDETYQYDASYRITDVDSRSTFLSNPTGINTAYNMDIAYYESSTRQMSSNIWAKSNFAAGQAYKYGENSACSDGSCAATVLTSAGDFSYKYDRNGNRVAEKLNGAIYRESKFTAYDKPWSITKGNNTSKFVYGASRQRILQVASTNGVKTETRYIGNVEWIVKDGISYYKRRIGGYAIEESGGSNKGVHYLHQDHQGSVIAITDDEGNLKQRLSYDVFGQQRDVLYNSGNAYIKPGMSFYDQIGYHTYDESLQELVRNAMIDSRGYTGHEMLEGVGLIHMNGRVYDPASGLFLSADPFVSAPGNQFNLNRYSYVYNNPVSYTDPSGYFVKELGRRISGASRYVSDRLASAEDHYAENRTAVQMVAITVATGGAGIGWAVAGGMAQGYLASGTFSGAVQGGIFAAITFGVGSAFGNVGWSQVGTKIGKIAVHGSIAGVRAEMQGGEFKTAFLAAGLSESFGGSIASIGGGAPAYAPMRIAAAAVLGGTSSRITGGSFANGAVSAAFVHAYNAENHIEDEYAQKSRYTIITVGISATVQAGFPQFGFIGAGGGGGTYIGFSIPDDLLDFGSYQAFVQFQANGFAGIGGFVGVGATGSISRSDSPLSSGSSTGIVTEGNAGWGRAIGVSFVSEGSVVNPNDWMNPVNSMGGTLFPKLGAGYGVAAGVGSYTSTLLVTPTW